MKKEAPELTRRKKILGMICETDYSPRELSKIFKTSQKEILKDLSHIYRTIKREGKRFFIRNPKCISCGYEFKLKEPKIPSKCPICNSQWIEEPRFMVS
ncbi:MAG: transcriptional regulator [Candidatus Methanofastidiosia archaeon]